MKTGISRLAGVAMGLSLGLFGGAAAAQTYNITFSGAPSSIACTNTDFTLAPGVSYSWSLPSGATAVTVTGTANGAVIQSDKTEFGSATGSAPLVGGPLPYASTAFPYTVVYTLRPDLPGASASSFSFVCASATGTNFSFINGGPFTISIPTLDGWGLMALASLLATASIMLLRRRSSRS